MWLPFAAVLFNLGQQFDEVISNGPLITDKDRDGFTLAAWQQDERSRLAYGHNPPVYPRTR